MASSYSRRFATRTFISEMRLAFYEWSSRARVSEALIDVTSTHGFVRVGGAFLIAIWSSPSSLSVTLNQAGGPWHGPQPAGASTSIEVTGSAHRPIRRRSQHGSPSCRIGPALAYCFSPPDPSRASGTVRPLHHAREQP